MKWPPLMAARSSARSTFRSITPTMERRSTRSCPTGAEVVFNTIVPPGLAPFLEQLHKSGLHEARRTPRLHVLRGELPELFPGRTSGRSVQLPRLLPERQRSLQQGTAHSVRQALSRRRQVHGWQCSFGHVPRSEALGGCGQRGRLVEARRRHQSTGPRKDRAGAWRSQLKWCPASITSG